MKKLFVAGLALCAMASLAAADVDMLAVDDPAVSDVVVLADFEVDIGDPEAVAVVDAVTLVQERDQLIDASSASLDRAAVCDGISDIGSVRLGLGGGLYNVMIV